MKNLHINEVWRHLNKFDKRLNCRGTVEHINLANIWLDWILSSQVQYDIGADEMTSDDKALNFNVLNWHFQSSSTLLAPFVIHFRYVMTSDNRCSKVSEITHVWHLVYSIVLLHGKFYFQSSMFYTDYGMLSIVMFLFK